MKSFGDVLNGRTRTGEGRFVLASKKTPNEEKTAGIVKEYI
jgi:hypothetical protein